ncbi:MAG: formate/nitrite transporter family protein [Peptoniphilus sp.]|nr:formate/nitrite transporter family protein [Peptoniphilus sp.]MDD7362701.1 formate/nitrite transporter family protein [Bacillota bacterium]MDY6044900.1 formate/nitrite transporter family protein [Peptoniphilus sp.]
MFQEDVRRFADTAAAKMHLFNDNLPGYFVASMLAGLYVGLGACVTFTIQALMNGVPGAKVVMGLAFSIALTLVVIAGAELFTGNNLVMSLGLSQKTVRLKDTAKLWIVCWIGNLLGSILCALLFVGAGAVTGDAQDVFLNVALTKAEMAFLPLFIRGILCNILVCLAVWGSGRIADGAGKILFIMLCIATFIISGFEHSVANMTLLSIGLLVNTSGALSFSGVVYNLLVVTFGNMVGGIGLVALPYALIGRKKS